MVDQDNGSVPARQDSAPGVNDDLPPGDHPLEVAARRGIGPLSLLGRQEWHGQARPCVSCGQLVLRVAAECDHCGQDLGNEMLARMRAHAGPWDVFEHLRPFPGVSLERIVRQIHRGVITETSIVRGPATDFQWRFTVETPGLCRYFGRCWCCHAEVPPSDTHCMACGSFLGFEPPQATPAGEAAALPGRPSGVVLSPAEQLEALSAALDDADIPKHHETWDGPPRIAGISATWIAAGLLIAVIVVLMWVTRARSRGLDAPAQPAAGLVVPAPNSQHQPG